MSASPDPGVGATAPEAAPVRLLKAFGRFWWDFLVGDTPELFVGAVLLMAVAAVIAHQVSARVGAVIALPAFVVLLLAGSARRAWRCQRSP